MGVREVWKPAHLEEDVEGRVELPVQGETTPLISESPTFRETRPHLGRPKIILLKIFDLIFQLWKR